MAGAVLSWGLYGPALHKGQVASGSPLKALLGVGVAYFLIAVLVPVATLQSQGQLGGFNTSGMMTSILGGALGAAGAVCIIFAFRAGGSPSIVMPLVFGGAPLVNVLVSMAHAPAEGRAQPAAVPRLPAGGAGRVHGAALQAGVVAVRGRAPRARSPRSPGRSTRCASPAA